MKKSLDIFYNKLQSATSISQINQELSTILSQYNITTFVITCYGKKQGSNNHQVDYSYMSSRFKLWHEHYHAEQYDIIDTTCQQTRHCNIPLYWDIHQQIKNATTIKEKRMREDSLAFGADCGLTIPLYSRDDKHAILLIEQMQGENGLHNWQALQFDFLAIGHYYYHHLRQFLLQDAKTKNTTCPLSRRQIQCLQLTANGLSVSDIAAKLSITQRTVNYHIQNTNKILGEKNKYLSAARAKQEQLID